MDNIAVLMGIYSLSSVLTTRPEGMTGILDAGVLSRETAAAQQIQCVSPGTAVYQS